MGGGGGGGGGIGHETSAPLTKLVAYAYACVVLTGWLNVTVRPWQKVCSKCFRTWIFFFFLTFAYFLRKWQCHKWTKC